MDLKCTQGGNNTQEVEKRKNKIEFSGKWWGEVTESLGESLTGLEQGSELRAPGPCWGKTQRDKAATVASFLKSLLAGTNAYPATTSGIHS